jgi:hypothetical protein
MSMRLGVFVNLLGDFMRFHGGPLSLSDCREEFATDIQKARADRIRGIPLDRDRRTI